MAEEITIHATTKEERYKELLPQVKALVDAEEDLIANMANICAALKFGMNFFWVGFYLVKQQELVLGPFQGPVACTRIQLGRGVCGTAWREQKTIVVKDVEQFPGHIACSALSKSEIVLPVFDSHKNMIAVLDVDSTELAAFDETDTFYLEQLVQLLKL